MITSQMKEKIDGLFKLWQEHPGAGGQLVIKYKGDVWEQCYGYADIENKIPMTQESVFNVASVTKQITAMCIVILHDRGQLDISDEVSKYLPEMMHYPQKITISHLLHHTSGLREVYDLWRMHKKPAGTVLTFPAAYELFSRQRELNFEPQTNFSYCNTGYLMMVEIVKRVSGMPMHAFAKKNIFEPLGMTSTMFVDGPGVEVPNRVMDYHDDGWQYTRGGTVSYVYGSGGMRTTCRDMAKYMPQYVDPTIISKKTLDEVFLNIPPLKDGTVTNYACGLRIDTLCGHKYYHHGGVTGGFRTVTAIYPEDDLVITAYTNTYNIPIEVAGRDIARIILGLPERNKKNLDEYRSAPIEPAQAQGYYMRLGNGGDFDSNCYDIRFVDGELYVMFNGKPARLTRMGDNLYKMGRRDVTFAFGEHPAVNREGAVVPLQKMGDSVCPETAAQLAGTYYSDETDGEVTVAANGDSITVSVNDGVPQVLHRMEEDIYCFGSMGSPNKLRFCRDAAGTVTGLCYMLPQVVRMPYVKRP